jgi:hypothetical protein
MSLIKRFPSYDQIFRGAVASVARFPFTLLSALVGVVSAVILVEPSTSGDPWIFERLLACSALGLPLFTALTFLAEKRVWSGGRKVLIQSVGLVLLIIYFFTIPNKLNEPMHHLVRFALLNIGLHFLVAWLPWTGKDQLVGFWQYNKALFLRFLVSALYSAVLFIGLALALAAVDQLFGADIKPETYFRLWIIIAGLFNTWVFLAGVPKDLSALNQGGEYPSGLKVFTQFILLPLVGLYFTILIVYEAKIVFTWNWPKGWVSELVLWYSVVGILSLLLLHPLRERIESRWIQAISKWFYRALVPLVAMLFLAIMRRINDYGMTEMRYFVLAMAVGLTIVMLYMIVSKRKDVRLIPIVICLIAFFSAYGPWSAFAMSRHDQRERLVAKMTECGLLVNGQLAKPGEQPSVEDRREMSSAVEYLSELHGMDPFSAWIADSTRARLDTLSVFNRADEITPLLGFTYVTQENWDVEGKWLHLVIGTPRPIDLSGYDQLLPFEGLSASSPRQDFPFERDTCRLEFDSASITLTLSIRGAALDTVVLAVIPLKDPLLELMENTTTDKFTPQDLSFVPAEGGSTVKVVLEMVNGRRVKSGLEIYGLSGYLLMHRPQ